VVGVCVCVCVRSVWRGAVGRGPRLRKHSAQCNGVGCGPCVRRHTPAHSHLPHFPSSHSRPLPLPHPSLPLSHSRAHALQLAQVLLHRVEQHLGCKTRKA
jgi:hypothetical protein